MKTRSKTKPNILRGDGLKPNIAASARFEKKLNILIKGMAEQVQKKVTKLFESNVGEQYFAEDASISSQSRILLATLQDKFDSIFASFAKPFAESIADEANRGSVAALNSSLKDIAGDFTIKASSIPDNVKEILNATISENVQLIKSIPQQYLTQVQGAVMRSITTGNGLQDLVPELERQYDITKRRARLIAHDQTRKAFANLSRVRMTNAGLKKFEWRHTSGSKEPRPLHIEYNGRIFDFDNLPVIDKKTGERGIPGQLINCRCFMMPVIDFGE